VLLFAAMSMEYVKHFEMPDAIGADEFSSVMTDLQNKADVLLAEMLAG
jgi:hypothetical protein